MSIISKLAGKYDNTSKDLRLFRSDKRNRMQKDLQEDITYLDIEKQNFNAQILNIIEKTKMNKLKTIVKGKEYKHKSLLILSSLFSTLGILITNKWITCKNGLHMTFDVLSFTTLICFVVAYIFYKIMDKAYKHFFNVPFLFNNFDKAADRKKDKIINVISLCGCMILFIFSMITNTIAFIELGANIMTSVFLGVGIDLINIYCVWYKNKFTSLDGYNIDITSDKKLNNDNNKNSIQNIDNRDFGQNLDLNFFDSNNNNKTKTKIEKFKNKDVKVNRYDIKKVGRKIDKRTREKLLILIKDLPAGKQVTKKNIGYTGDDKLLKRLCTELDGELVKGVVGKDGKTRFYKK